MTWSFLERTRHRAKLTGRGLDATKAVALAASALLATGANAQQASQVLPGPGAVSNQLSADSREFAGLPALSFRQSVEEWKKGLREGYGLDVSVDYNVLGFAATESLGEDTSAAGAFRVYGFWELLDRGTPNKGGLVFKFENRHGFTDVPPTDFGSEIGYAGLVSSVFSDQGWRVTNLYWKQDFAGGRGVTYLGFMDVTDYVDVYALASPWTGFSNIAFQTGSGTIGGLPDGALGAMAGGFLTDNVYLVGGLADANAKANAIDEGFDTFFNEFETFKSLEVGWTTGQDDLFVNNAHLTFWQIDARDVTGTPDGHGVAFSVSGAVGESWLPFLRGGWSDGGGSLYEAAISAGFGYTRSPGRNLTGLGINWSRPNRDTFGGDLDDQVTVEAFQRLQLTEGFEITPSVQIITNPALNPSEDTIALFGLRMRAAF